MHMCLRLLRYGCLSTVVLFGSCTPMKVSEGNAAVQGISRQQIVGSWGSVVTDDGFGSKVLVVVAPFGIENETMPDWTRSSVLSLYSSDLKSIQRLLPR